MGSPAAVGCDKGVGREGRGLGLEVYDVRMTQKDVGLVWDS